MSSEAVFLIYYLGEYEGGKYITKFIFECNINDVIGEFGVEFDKLKDVLVSKMPQLEKENMVGYEDIDAVLC